MKLQADRCITKYSVITYTEIIIIIIVLNGGRKR